jgi:hypothetical protein
MSIYLVKKQWLVKKPRQKLASIQNVRKSTSNERQKENYGGIWARNMMGGPQ